MKKHVPEGPDVAGEVSRLRDELTGNQLFGGLRGKLGVSLAEHVRMLLDRCSTPSQVCEEWDHFVSSVRPMVNRLAKLRRGEYAHAEAALLEALSSPDYMFPDETVPIERTTPVTLLMLEPKRTLLLIRWLLSGQPRELEDFLSSHGSSRPLVRELFASFPNMRECLEGRDSRCDWPSDGLRWMYHDYVTASLDVRELFPGARAYELGYGSYHRDLSLQLGEQQRLQLLYAVEGEQRDVVAKLRRENAKRVATWQLRIPSIMLQDSNALLLFKFRFYPEGVHSVWNALYPALLSKGFNQGLGVVAKKGPNILTPAPLVELERELLGKNAPIRAPFAFTLSGIVLQERGGD